MGTNNFTYDFQSRTPTFSGTKFLLSNSYNLSGSMGVYLDNRQLLLTLRDDTGSEVVNNLNGGEAPVGFFHLAIVRYSTQIIFFVNGNITNTATIPSGSSFSGNKVEVGYASPRALANSFAASDIDELRISKGIARWTSNFTPPTAPYGPIILPPKKNIIHPSLLSTSIAQK